MVDKAHVTDFVHKAFPRLYNQHDEAVRKDSPTLAQIIRDAAQRVSQGQGQVQ